MCPVLFHIGPLPISPYGLLLAVALVICSILAVRRARLVGVSDSLVMDVIFFGVLAGFAGGRLAYILTHWDDFLDDPMALILDRAGFQFLGGLIAAIGVACWVIHKRGERFLAVADLLAAPLALGHCLGRIGCFCAGCCYGAVCPSGFEGWGVRFPLVLDLKGRVIGSPALLDHIDHGLVEVTAVLSKAVWPTQLYEATANLALFLLLTLLWRRRRFTGQVFAAYVYGYGCLRFVVEFFRGDADRGALLWFSTSQWLCLAAMGAVSLWLIALHPVNRETRVGHEGGPVESAAVPKASARPPAPAAQPNPSPGTTPHQRKRRKRG